jgi:hypothetical protein
VAFREAKRVVGINGFRERERCKSRKVEEIKTIESPGIGDGQVL